MSSASGGGATAEEREGRKNRQVDWRAARLGAVSGVLAGLLAAAIGLGGVWYGTNITADREDERSNREFLQTQRVTVCSEYLTAVDEARQLMGPFLPPDDAGETRRLELPYPDAPRLLAIQGANDDVETLFSRVHVLAGVDVAIEARRSLDESGMIEDVLEFSTNCHTDTNPDLGCYEPAGTLPSTSGEQVHWDRGQHAEYRRNFVVAIRQELGVPE